MSETTVDRILFRLKTRGPESIADLSAAFGVTSEAVRQLLVKLEAEGLVAFEDQRAGRGRPKRLWRLTETGHARFPDRHADLSLSLLDAVRAEFGEAGLDRLIARREAEQRQAYLRATDGAGSLEERVARLADLRHREGYMAEWWREEDGALLLIENHCPICAAAASCQNLCRSELTVFREALGSDATVERVDHVLAGGRRCAYRVTAA
ncbi:metalloregulator ArsR/SmtB family transcription factor [Thalassobaculum sp. OXR-137]|uniref:helix-turn-helix transcriptional regulator n=1 Tax=Thalassobaculum sp. OXR-137 TaxID=3100173 RepID=UPI002AC9EBFB|nr:metalloregulator ArsR/SmtB family transcription factor [Thalassobaculum sp. OXR-137]WPZ36866.1 metalloregulator ArsR/SmtB family transcription factor [Thalassobaculum sp. OXR-137]